MKVLFCDFDEGWHVNIIERICNHLDADYVISISNIKHEIAKNWREYIWVNNEELNYHRYDSFHKWDLPSLDADLLESLSMYESLYLSMLDRSELVLSKDISYKKRMEYYYQDLRIMLYLINKVDLCIFSNIPHVGFDFVLYGLCRVLNVPHVIQYFCPFVPKLTSSVYFIQDIFDHIPEMKYVDYSNCDSVSELSSRMKVYYDYYGRKKEEITQVIKESDFTEDGEGKGLSQKINLVLSRAQKGLLGATLRRQLKNRVAGYKTDHYFDKKCYRPQKEKYLYFPLHYQPECTSLPMGGVFHNQELVVNLLSKHVPKDVKIYVKPHPNRSWFADADFYDRILSSPNVCLIHPHYNSYELMDSALAVVSLTGTPILEALIRNIPVLMFGYYVFQYAPGVFHCKSNKDVKNAINSICENGYCPEKNKIHKFFCELDKYVYDGSLSESISKMCEIPLETSEENIVRGYVSFLKKIGIMTN